jgi:hypothetical protein
MIVPPPTARVIAAVTHGFWEDELAQGKLLYVTCLPGFGWIHTLSLEAWFEAIPKTVLAANRATGWQTEQFHRMFFRKDWLQGYAHALTTQAIQMGHLIREPCAFCGEQKTEAHHPNYAEPLRIIWLCKQDHGLHHNRLREAEKLISLTNQPVQLKLIPKSWHSCRQDASLWNGLRNAARNS